MQNEKEPKEPNHMQTIVAGRQTFWLFCKGTEDACENVPMGFGGNCPGKGTYHYLPFPNERQAEIIKVFSECGLSEKCVGCLQKVK